MKPFEPELILWKFFITNIISCYLSVHTLFLESVSVVCISLGILSKLSNLLLYNYSHYSFIIPIISLRALVMYLLYFWYSNLNLLSFSLVSLAKVLSFIIYLFKKPTFGFNDFLYCFSILYFINCHYNLY